MTEQGEVQLGDRVRDEVTGYEGICTSIHTYLWACRRIGIQQEKVTKDGKVEEPLSFDEPQVKIIKRGVHGPKPAKVAATPARRTGGPRRYEPTR